MSVAEDESPTGLPQDQPPRPFEGDASRSQELVMAAYALRQPKPSPDAEPLREEDQVAGASVVAEQVLALRKEHSPVDPAEFKHRLAGVIRGIHPVPPVQ